jgi:excisionase family DNA binding protein
MHAVERDWVSETVATLAPLATAKEAAAFLRCNTRTLRRMIADGRIKSIRGRETGSSPVLVPRGEIERYLRGLMSP